MSDTIITTGGSATLVTNAADKSVLVTVGGTGDTLVSVYASGSPAGSSTAVPPLTISGTLAVGSTLTATPAAGWVMTSYQWRRNAVNISGATSSTYTLTNADGTATIDCVGTGSPTATAGVVPGIAPTITATASILVAQAGTPLTFTSPSATGAPTPTWVNDVMSGASVVQSNVTSGSYTPPTAGPSLAIRTTATNGVSPDAVATGSAVTVTAAPTPAPAPAPTPAPAPAPTPAPAPRQPCQLLVSLRSSRPIASRLLLMERQLALGRTRSAALWRTKLPAPISRRTRSIP